MTGIPWRVPSVARCPYYARKVSEPRIEENRVETRAQPLSSTQVVVSAGSDMWVCWFGVSEAGGQ